MTPTEIFTIFTGPEQVYRYRYASWQIAFIVLCLNVDVVKYQRSFPFVVCSKLFFLPFKYGTSILPEACFDRNPVTFLLILHLQRPHCSIVWFASPFKMTFLLVFFWSDSSFLTLVFKFFLRFLLIVSIIVCLTPDFLIQTCDLRSVIPITTSKNSFVFVISVWWLSILHLIPRLFVRHSPIRPEKFQFRVEIH